MKKFLIILAAAALLTSCGMSTADRTRGSEYAQMYEEHPATLLIMPPINMTTNVDAKDFLYTSISRPLIEAGYYVVSPLLAMDILKEESAYDAELFVDRPLEIFRQYFGVDAVVFSEIHTWTKRGFGIDTEIRYYIKSAVTGEIIFDRTCDLYLDLSVSSGSGNDKSLLSLLVEVAASAINTATTDHIEAARMANYYIFRDIPRGKYHPLYQQDSDFIVDPQNIKTSVKR